MTRDQVIEAAKDWASLFIFKANAKPYTWHEQERTDVLNACVDLAFNKTKEALVAYAKEREEQFKAHERMLETIEQTLQEEFIHGD